MYSNIMTMWWLISVGFLSIQDVLMCIFEMKNPWSDDLFIRLACGRFYLLYVSNALKSDQMNRHDKSHTDWQLWTNRKYSRGEISSKSSEAKNASTKYL